MSWYIRQYVCDSSWQQINNLMITTRCPHCPGVTTAPLLTAVIEIKAALNHLPEQICSRHRELNGVVIVLCAVELQTNLCEDTMLANQPARCLWPCSLLLSRHFQPEEGPGRRPSLWSLNIRVIFGNLGSKLYCGVCRHDTSLILINSPQLKQSSIYSNHGAAAAAWLLVVACKNCGQSNMQRCRAIPRIQTSTDTYDEMTN